MKQTTTDLFVGVVCIILCLVNGACSCRTTVVKQRTNASGEIIILVPVGSSLQSPDIKYIRRICDKYLPKQAMFSVASVTRNKPKQESAVIASASVPIGQALQVPVTITYSERGINPGFLKELETARTQIEADVVKHFSEKVHGTLMLHAEIVKQDSSVLSSPLKIKVSRTNNDPLLGQLKSVRWAHGHIESIKTPVSILFCRFVPLLNGNSVEVPPGRAVMVESTPDFVFHSEFTLIVRVDGFPNHGEWARSNGIRILPGEDPASMRIAPDPSLDEDKIQERKGVREK